MQFCSRISQEMRGLKWNSRLAVFPGLLVASRKRCVDWNKRWTIRMPVESGSHLARDAWIEICAFGIRSGSFCVASRKRCVDWNSSVPKSNPDSTWSHLARDAWIEIGATAKNKAIEKGRISQEMRGLKYKCAFGVAFLPRSHLARDAWIEIAGNFAVDLRSCRISQEMRGLKFCIQAWQCFCIFVASRKRCVDWNLFWCCGRKCALWSHLARDAWIEIGFKTSAYPYFVVASRKRCVDWNCIEHGVPLPDRVALRKECVHWIYEKIPFVGSDTHQTKGFLEPSVGIEPTTSSLPWMRSTYWAMKANAVTIAYMKWDFKTLPHKILWLHNFVRKI